MPRKQIPYGTFENTLTRVKEQLNKRLTEKGYGGLASRHEIYGVVADEVSELLASVQTKAPIDAVVDELYDIAVACILGIASCDIHGGTIDW